jgi:ornithine carbamoyltransferase
VVNALTDGHHPLQSITDVFTLGEIFGDLRMRRIAYVGAGNNVAHSLMQACALAGMDIAVPPRPATNPTRSSSPTPRSSQPSVAA